MVEDQSHPPAVLSRLAFRCIIIILCVQYSQFFGREMCVTRCFSSALVWSPCHQLRVIGQTLQQQNINKSSEIVPPPLLTPSYMYNMRIRVECGNFV